MVSDLLSESYVADLEESWENERTADALMGVRRPPSRNWLFSSRDNNDFSQIRR